MHRISPIMMLVVLAILPCTAPAAQPPRFNYQALLTDAEGAPLEGNHSINLRLYEGGAAQTPDSGTLRYEENTAKLLDDGILNHAVGTGTPVGPVLSRAVFATDNDLFLQVKVGGNTILPRTRIESVPYAIHAGEATTAAVALYSLASANGDARTPIDPTAPGFATPLVLDQPGSYYLTGPIAVTSGDAIHLTANNISLDLNGFTIQSTANPPFGIGILVDGTRNTLIHNGHIQSFVTYIIGEYGGTGFRYGITGLDSVARNVIVRDITVTGVDGDGIGFGFGIPAQSNVVIENCTVMMARFTGIQGESVSRCIAAECGMFGIDAQSISDSHGQARTHSGLQGVTISNSVGEALLNGDGISGFNIMNCFGESQTGSGIAAFRSALNSTGISASGTGLETDMAKNSHGSSNSGMGIDAVYLVDNCVAINNTASLPALKVIGTANICSAANQAGGVAIDATVGIGCTTFGGSSEVDVKFLGTP